MYKAIKENKIIAINEKEYFPCLVYDAVEEDKEHTCEDYAQYEGEFLLKEDIPAPTEEEIKALRAEAYLIEVDPITAHIQRLRDEVQTEEIVMKIEDLIEERYVKVQEIKERFPYSTDQSEESYSSK